MLRRFFRDRRGSLAIEFALIFPLTLLYILINLPYLQLIELRRNTMFVAMAGIRAGTAHSGAGDHTQAIARARAAIATTSQMYASQGITFEIRDITYPSGDYSMLQIVLTGTENAWYPLQQPTISTILIVYG